MRDGLAAACTRRAALRDRDVLPATSRETCCTYVLLRLPYTAVHVSYVRVGINTLRTVMRGACAPAYAAPGYDNDGPRCAWA